jgi:hypothetical protein
MRWEDIQAGHIIDGRGASILFVDEGIFPQCYDCNCPKNGNKVEYKIWFIKNFGEEKLNELRMLAKKPFKPSRREDDYSALIEEYKFKILQLKGGKDVNSTG